MQRLQAVRRQIWSTCIGRSTNRISPGRPLGSQTSPGSEEVRFEEALVSGPHRYSLGIEVDSGRHYVAIPVSNQMVDYMEYYKLSDDEYQVFSNDGSLALGFADSCRRREQDDRLFMQPGANRGVPR